MNEESNIEGTEKGGSKKKPAQLKKNDNCAMQDVKVQESTTEGKCVAGPVLTRAQAKKYDKIHPLKVNQSSANKSTIEDFQEDSTLRNALIE